MCRLLVWDLDRPEHPDAHIEAGRYQRGMVVSILDDGQHPGTDIAALGWWVLVDLPGVPKAKAEIYVTPMLEDIDKSKLPRKRLNGVALDALATEKGRAKDAATAVDRIEATEADLTAKKVVFTYVADPAMIGPDPLVIG